MERQRSLVALEELFLELFNGPELREFVGHLPEGERLTHWLVWGHIPLKQLVSEAVHLMERHGLIDREFFDALRHHRPRRERLIGAVESMFSTPATGGRVGPPLDELVVELRIRLITANTESDALAIKFELEAALHQQPHSAALRHLEHQVKMALNWYARTRKDLASRHLLLLDVPLPEAREQPDPLVVRIWVYALGLGVASAVVQNWIVLRRDAPGPVLNARPGGGGPGARSVL